jgi:uncharacterized protein YciI
MTRTHPSLLFVACALSIVLGACASARDGGQATKQPAPVAAEPADPRYDTDFVLVILKTGPRGGEYTPEQRKEIQAGHRANMMRLAGEGKLFVAGPFGDPRHDPNWRGIFVFDVRSVAEARALSETDPGASSGVFAMEPIPIRAAGWLRGVLGLETEMIARAKAEGRELTGQDQIRAYVILIAGDAANAEHALAPLVANGKVVMSARLGGEHAGGGLYVLDYEKVEDARRELALDAASSASCTFDAWWATPNLAALANQQAARGKGKG